MGTKGSTGNRKYQGHLEFTVLQPESSQREIIIKKKSVADKYLALFSSRRQPKARNKQ